jgi:hypothetical protein
LLARGLAESHLRRAQRELSHAADAGRK